MLHTDITWLTSAVTASVFAHGVTRKDAHRGGSLPNTSGSRLPTRVRIGLVTRKQEGYRLFAVSIGYSPESAPSPGGGETPSLAVQPLCAPKDPKRS